MSLRRVRRVLLVSRSSFVCLVYSLGSSLFFGGMGGVASAAARASHHNLTGPSPEPRRSTLDPDRGYYGEAPARLRRGPHDGPVEGWENGGPDARLLGGPGQVARGRREAGKGQMAGGEA
jgi:hypothetical protein